MTEPELLSPKELAEVLKTVIDEGMPGVMTHLTGGKWHMADVAFRMMTDSTLHVELQGGKQASPIDIQVNQPVGLSSQHAHNKYIFETVVVGFESSVNDSCSGKVVLELPDRMERMQRRAYNRVTVPDTLNVEVLFWHRGYMDTSTEAPLENYWKGRLVDISAGGLQIGIDLEQGANFRASQLVGLQFTPRSYQKPLLLEAQVKHLAEHAEDRQLYVGVEFIGLEMSGEGRQKVHRLVEIVDMYEKENALAHRPTETVYF